MATTKKDPALVVLQLTGANDYLNTIIPYTNGHYRDARPRVSISEDEVLPIDGELAFNPNMAPVKQLYDEGKVAIIHGIGFDNSPRSHFRTMDIWHTCEPDKVGTEGWAAKVIRDLDPKAENVLKGVNFGQGLPRALALRGVPVTSVSNLESYGVLSGVPGVAAQQERDQLLDRFARMYAPAVGSGPTMDYLGQTGRDALVGADIIKAAPQKYSSTVEYAETPVAKYLPGRGTGVSGRPGHPDVLHRPRQLGHPLQPDAGSPEAVERHIPGHRRFLRRPQGARHRGQPGNDGVHRVRPPGAGQRHWHRPRGRAGWPSSLATGSRAGCTVPIPR